MTEHPQQPVEADKKGTLRFKENSIISYILENGGIDMNTIARGSFPDEDRRQFAQLIGYSVGGYSDLSYVGDHWSRDASEPILLWHPPMAEKEEPAASLEYKNQTYEIPYTLMHWLVGWVAMEASRTHAPPEAAYNLKAALENLRTAMSADANPMTDEEANFYKSHGLPYGPRYNEVRDFRSHKKSCLQEGVDITVGCETPQLCFPSIGEAQINLKRSGPLYECERCGKKFAFAGSTMGLPENSAVIDGIKK